MADLLSGGQKSLSPWIQSTVYEHLLHELRTRNEGTAGGDVPSSWPVEENRPKIVQLIDLGGRTASNHHHDNNNNDDDDDDVDYDDDYVLISDGKHSIVASHIWQNYPSPPRLTRGCVVRIHDWHVSSDRLCTSSLGGNVGDNDDGEEEATPHSRLVQQHATIAPNRRHSHHSHRQSSPVVVLKVSGTVRRLGSKDIAGDPIPVLQDTDVQRVLLALHDATITSTTPYVSTTGTVTRDTTGVDDDPTRGASWPLGSLARLFGAGNEAAVVAVCRAAVVVQAHEGTLPEESTPHGSAVAAASVTVPPIAESRERTTNTEARVAGTHVNPYRAASSEDTDDDYDDDDEEIENYGISAMLVEPTQDVLQETQVVVFSEHDPEHDLFSRIESRSLQAAGHGGDPSRSNATKSLDASLSGNEDHSHRKRVADDPGPIVDGWNEGGVEQQPSGDALDKDDRETQSLESQPNERLAGHPHNHPTGCRNVAVTTRKSHNAAGTASAASAAAEQQELQRVPTATSLARLVSNLDRWERMADQAAAASAAEPRPTTAIVLPTYGVWAGDSLRASLE